LVTLTASDYVTNVVFKTTKRNRKTLANPNSAGRRSMNMHLNFATNLNFATKFRTTFAASFREMVCEINRMLINLYPILRLNFYLVQ
jgi:hypothetical protein